jgi:phosphopantetheinyl transferase (holo-ACP synthase)
VTRVGIDVSSIREWGDRLERTPALRMTAFATEERLWCDHDPAAFALAWAVKESAVKLLGTGFVGVGWRGVWSRPAADGGFEVVLGLDAQRTSAAKASRGPLRCAVRRHGDLVVAVLVAGPGDVVTRFASFEDHRDRRVRRTSSRAAARRAGLDAAAALDVHRGTGADWLSPSGEAPGIVWPDGTTAAASCSHAAGLACAAVAGPSDGSVREQKYGSSDYRRSANLLFRYDDSLFTAERPASAQPDGGGEDMAHGMSKR